MRWDSKFSFIAVRVILAAVGVLRTIAVIRLLSLEDYALVGIVESTRNLVSTLLGFGVGDSISREGAIEKDHNKFAGLIFASFFSATGLNIITGCCLYILSFYTAQFSIDPKAAGFLIIAVLISTVERYWLLSLSVIRIQDGHKSFLVYSFLNGLLGAAFTIYLTWRYGLIGYFHSQWVIGAFLLLFLIVHIALKLRSYQLNKSVFTGLIGAMSRLWAVSWFMYMSKGSGVIWRRAPLLLGSQVVDSQAIGIIAISLDLATKLQLLQQSLSPLIIPKLSKQFSDSKSKFYKAAKTELKQIFSLTVFACIAGFILWAYFGDLLIGRERWLMIGGFFYLAIAVEFSLAIVGLFNICIMIPTKTVDGLSLITIGVRLCTVPLLYGLIVSKMDNTIAILAAMLVPGVLLAVIYSVKGYLILRNIRNTE